MRISVKAVFAPLLAAVIATLGCHAQVPPAGSLSPELSRRVELLIRSRTKIPPNYTMTIGPRTPSDVSGFDKIEIVVTAEGAPSHPVPFLLSTDGKTLAQFNKYDISTDPRLVVSGANRPARGGPEGAPVDIVVFDDLECPYCAKMHAQLFPALLDRYGKNVRIEYKDFPLSQHPWAMRAAIDTSCVGDKSTPAYWNLVDFIHLHAAEIGGPDHNLEKAGEMLDKLSLDEAKKNNVKADEVEACIKKQDQTAVKASMKIGEDLGVEATPVLFINGEKLEGAYPLVDVFRMVDEALIAQGKPVPPKYQEPSSGPGVKPGN